MTPPETDTRVFEIYLVRNKINDKRYVGQTRKGLKRRWYMHKYSAEHGSRQYLHVAMHRDGVDAFEASLIETRIGQSEADQAERKWIALLQTQDPRKGYNSTDGGNTTGETKLTPEACEKISASKRGRPLLARTNKTDARDKPVIDAIKAGLARREVEALTGRTASEIFRALVRHKRMHDPELVWDELSAGETLQAQARERNAKVIELIEAGLKNADIAAKCGITGGLVKTIRQRHKKFKVCSLQKAS